MLDSLQLDTLRQLLAERKIALELTTRARGLLFREGHEPAYGARPPQRALQRLVQNPLAQKILKGEILPGETVTVDADLTTAMTTFEQTQTTVSV